MREILFRGKTEDGRWVNGSLLRGINRYIDGNEVMYIYPVDTRIHDYGVVSGYFGERVIPETVGQFTGLFDKDGIAIFEGDIVLCCGEYRSVIYDNEYAEFEFDDHDPVKYPEGLSLCSDHLGCEVIGNIHDNPELLEVK